MKKKEFLESLNNLIGQAELEEALKNLIAFLNKENKYSRLEKIARKTQALFIKTGKAERSGTISFDNAQLNYNSITDTLLQLAEDIEKENLNPSRYEIEKDRTSQWQLIVSVLIFLLIGAGLLIWLVRSSEPFDDACPEFKKSSRFNILLLPFDNLDGTNLEPQKQIKVGFAQKIREYNLQDQADIEIAEKDDGMQNAFTTEEAAAMGKSCLAKLVMWGRSETVDDQKEIIASYKLIDKENLDLDLLQIDEEAETVQRVKRITSIKADGILTRNVDLIIRAFFGLMAHEMGQHKIAIENLQEVSNTIDPENKEDSTALMIVSTVLADSYIQTQQVQKAIQSYDNVLAIHPGYKLANNNKAILLYDLKEYDQALPYLNNLLAKDTTNIQLRKIRASAFYKTDKLNKAKIDYQYIQQKNPEDQQSRSNLIKINAEISARKARTSNVNTLSANSATRELLEKNAKNNFSIGNYSAASKAANKLLQVQKNSFLAHSILIETELEQKDTAKAKIQLKKAIASGISTAELYKKFPTLKPPIRFKPRTKKPTLNAPSKKIN